MNEIERLERLIELKKQAMFIFNEEKSLEIDALEKQIRKLEDEQI